MGEVSIRLFGTFEVRRNGIPIEGKEWLRRKNQMLLKYLVVNRGQPITQDQLIEAVYPERPGPENVRNLLARISEVRRILEPDLPRGSESQYIVRMSQGTYMFPIEAPCSIDTEQYRTALRRAHMDFERGLWHDALVAYHHASELYRGDFLAEDLYDDWTGPLRDELRDTHLNALLNTAQCHLKLGDYRKAVQFFESSLRLDPLEERGHRGKMLALYHLGDIRRALSSYEECAAALSEDDLEPDEETVALFHAVKSASLPKERPAVRHNLPSQATPFIGRAHELHEVRLELRRDDTKCVTVLGPGGIGKTRLAIEVALASLDQFSDGVFYIDTPQDATSPQLVSLIVESLGQPLPPRGNPQEYLLRTLRNMTALLVIDNGEHALGATDLIDEIVSETSVRILAASRERLHISGEVIIELQGLSHVTTKTYDHDLIASTDAARLYEDLMRRVDHRFRLDQTTSPHVARICRMLGGMPLALAIAAAWGRALSTRDIADRIEDNFAELEPTLVDKGTHKQSVLGILNYTWSQLTPDERDALMGLSVSRKGISSDAALSVTGKNLSVLMGLRDKALLYRMSPDRYGIHELLRQFAEERLGARHADAVDRHSAYFVEQMAKSERLLMSTEQVTALRQLQEDWDNLTVTWHRSVEADRFDRIEAMLESFCRIHVLRSRWQELRSALELALSRLELLRNEASDSATSIPTAKRLFGALQVKYGYALYSMAEYTRALEVLEAGLETARELGDEFLEGVCMVHLGRLLFTTGKPKDAEPPLRTGVEIMQKVGSPHELAMALCFLGVSLNMQRRYKEAIAALEDGLRIYRELGDPTEIAGHLINLGNAYGAQAEWSMARACYQQCFELAQEIEHQLLILLVNANLGQIQFNERNYPGAKASYMNAFHVAKETGDRHATMFASYYLTITCSKLGQVQEAKDYLATGVQALIKEPVEAFWLRFAYAAGHLMQANQRLSEALALFYFALNHPGTPEPTRSGMRQDAEYVEALLDASTVESAKRQANDLDLQYVATWLESGLSAALGTGTI